MSVNFTFMWPCVVTNFFITKPTRCTNSSNLFWHETLHVSNSSSVHQQEFIHCTLSNGICHTAFEQDQDGNAGPSWSCSTAVYKPVWHIPLLSVQWINCWWWAEELSETCRVSCQNKFEELVRLVGFVIKKEWLCFVSKITLQINRVCSVRSAVIVMVSMMNSMFLDVMSEHTVREIVSSSL